MLWLIVAVWSVPLVVIVGAIVGIVVAVSRDTDGPERASLGLAGEHPYEVEKAQC